MTKEINFNVTYNEAMNLIYDYANHEVSAEEYEIKATENEAYDELETNPDYMYHMGCVQTYEKVLRTLGISPDSNIVIDAIIAKRKER